MLLRFSFPQKYFKGNKTFTRSGAGWSTEFYPTNKYIIYFHVHCPDTFLPAEEYVKRDRDLVITRLILRWDWLNLWVVTSTPEKQQVPERATGCPQKLDMTMMEVHRALPLAGHWGWRNDCPLLSETLCYLCSFSHLILATCSRYPSAVVRQGLA